MKSNLTRNLRQFPVLWMFKMAHLLRDDLIHEIGSGANKPLNIGDQSGCFQVVDDQQT